MAVNPSAKSNYLSKVQLNGGTYWVKDAELRELLESAATKTAIEQIITSGAGANNTNNTIPTTLALTSWLEAQIAGLTGAMHFMGVTDPQAGETPAARIDALYQSKSATPAAGDIVIDGTKEFVYDGTNWKELGDEGTYATQAQLETAVSGIQVGGVALGQDHAVTASELITALGLKALAFKDEASGSITVPAASQTLAGLAKAGEYTVSGTAITVPQTYSSLDVTPAGSVALTQETNAAATYDKAASVAVPTVASVSYDKVDSDVAVTAAAPGQGESANYTPAGTITLPSFTASLNLAEDSVATVSDPGTSYSLSGGGVSRAANSSSAFATEGVTAAMDTTDPEMLVFSAAGTTNAITEVGALTFTTPTLSGALPTFGTKDVVIKTGSTASAAASGDATFTGTGVLLSGTATASSATATITPGTQNVIPTYETANATMTQPEFSAAFTGTSKSVTPVVATSANAAPADAKVTVATEDKAITLATETKNVTVS